jgi:hypothetical protein
MPWRQDRVFEMVVNELVPLVVCVPFLVLIRVLQGKPFATVGFDVPNEMAKMTTDGCWCFFFAAGVFVEGGMVVGARLNGFPLGRRLPFGLRPFPLGLPLPFPLSLPLPLGLPFPFGVPLPLKPLTLEAAFTYP